MIELVFPFSMGEWFAWIVAFLSLLYGLCLMFFPRLIMMMEGLQGGAQQERAQKASAMQAIRGPYGGIWAGLGLACLLLAQPLVYLALGLAFIMVVIGRLYSFLLDQNVRPWFLVLLGADMAGAFLPLAYVFQLIP